MLSGGSQKQLVGVAVTLNIGVEMILIDRKTGQVQKYAQRPLEYNAQKREIEDYSAFKGAVIDMCTELDINIKSDFYVVLPSVLFSFIDLPPSIMGEEVENVLVAKVEEESFVFKKTEPMVSHSVARVNTADQSNFTVYSAIQKEVVLQLQDIFKELGGSLVGVECANTAMLRGVEFLRFADDMIKNNYNWNVLVVSSNNYVLFALSGNSVIDCIEIPLAIKSFAIEEAYQVVSSSVSQNLPNYPAEKLIIVSQTDDISAEVLKTQISFDEEVEVFECNKYAKETRLSTGPEIRANEILHVSLSAIGAGRGQDTKLASILNFLSKGPTVSAQAVTILGITVMMTDQMFLVIMAIIAGVFAAIFGAAYFGLNMAKEGFETDNATRAGELAQIQTELAAVKEEKAVINIEDLTAKIIDNNKKAMSYYDSFSTEIPKNVWLTYAYLKDGENIAVEGLSLGINDIYEYYKGLKNSSPASTIQLRKLRVITDISTGKFDPTSDELKLYDFEISNTTSKKQSGGTAKSGEGTEGSADDHSSDAIPPPTGGGGGKAPDLEPIDETN